MLGALLRGISTREYKDVLPEMAEAVGVSRSSVSRQAIEASEKQLRVLRERRWDQVEILVIYIDGQRFGEHHVMGAVGVDLLNTLLAHPLKRSLAMFVQLVPPAVQFRRVYFQRPRHFRRWLPALQPLNRSHFELFRKLPSNHHSSFPFR